MPNSDLSVTIPISDEVGAIYIGTELATSDFSTASKLTLNRVYAALLDAGETLASGAEVNSTARCFEWILEAVAAAE